MKASDFFLIALGICIALVVHDVIRWWRGED